MPSIPRIPRAEPVLHPLSLHLRSLLHRISSLAALTTRKQQTVSPHESDQHALSRRQTVYILPATYDGVDGSDPAPGVVAGIVLGAIAGFLLIIWLLFWLFNQGSSNRIRGDEEVVVRSQRTRSRRTRSRRSSPRREMRTVERSVSRSPRRQTVIVEETRRTRERTPSIISVPAPPPPMPPPPPGSIPPAPRSNRESIHIVEERIVRSRSPERRVAGDDIVEVIEEHSDLSSVRPSEVRRSTSRRLSGGYRPVDPDAYAGGDFAQRKINGRGRYS
ncbi:hypothetical protein K402DRAFT_141190 [Aulographum hederae CBS 113979]|uniref:Uncharacterized protein n=1 Tax=Aulographum hederae CBS 113979 TaxID=1176131 RepID=A0A6G1GTR3_9PEZI|nr:hypothetical protein K402DRAFT_141190 [Aulographum hederae CBS 113979]